MAARKASARALVVVAALGCMAGLGIQRSDAHNPITSKYTYNEDIFPILRDRCGRCHVPDGVAPMSLMTYQDAFPWAESLRAELIAGHMPPWNVEASAVRFKNTPALTAIETDKIITWATGKTPQGNLEHVLPPVTIQRDWPLGKPDLVLPAPEETMDADTSEVTKEFTLSTGTAEQWISAVDLLPGTPAIVRNAGVSIKTNPAAAADQPIAPETEIAVWVPGEDPVAIDTGGFRLAAGAELVVRIHYLKTYANQGKEMSDESKIGLYFAGRPSREIQRLTISSKPVTTASPASVSFSQAIKEDLEALAFTPDPALSNASLKVELVGADGARTTVIQIAARPNWTRRYWFEQPLRLTHGATIEVTAILNGSDPLLPPTGTPLPPQKVDGAPLRVTFDVVSAGRNGT